MKTPQDQVRGGREEISPHSCMCVDSIGQHYYQTIYNSLFGEGCHWMVTVSTSDRGDSNSQLHQLKFAGQIVRGQE